MFGDSRQKFWQGAFVEVLGETWVAPTPPDADFYSADPEFAGSNLNTPAFTGGAFDRNGSREAEIECALASYLNQGRYDDDDDESIPFDEPEIG